MMDSPPVSDFPLFSKKFLNFFFSRKMSRCSSAKISDDLIFLNHRPQMSDFPLFSLFQYISPSCFAKIIGFPLFCKISLCFRKIHLLLHTLCVFRFPPTLTMMHLCITQCTYWTPLLEAERKLRWLSFLCKI